MISTTPVFPPSLVIPGLCVLTILFIFLELKKKAGFRNTRIIAIVVMMIGLAGIMLRPKYSSKKTDSILLLTSGYAPQKVDSVLSKHPNVSVMRLPDTRPFNKAAPITDYKITDHKIDFVAGEGLKLYQLDRLGDATFIYIPTSTPGGIIDLRMQEHYESHRNGTIYGSYNNKVGRTLISLHSPAGAEDSTVILEKGKKDFTLSFMPRLAGNFTYTLVIRDSANITKEIVPIHVNESRKLEILFLQYYPTFETQYLKSYLSEKKHRMVVRSQLSKNNFRHEFINREETPISRLSEQLLEGFDLIIADAISLATLTAREKNDLQRSLQHGLGLLSLTPVEKKSDVFPFETTSIKKDTTLVMVQQKPYVLSAIPIRVKKNQSIIPLMDNSSGILSGYTFRGAGKIGFQLLRETYQLRLAGDSLAYADIWVSLLEKVGRRKTENSTIKIITPFPLYEDEPIDIEVLSENENIILMDDSTSIPLREHLSLDNVWRGRTWGGKEGWHTLTTNQRAVKSYYIHSRPAWQALSITNQMRANMLRENERDDISSREITTMREVPQIFFFLLLVLAAGYAWLAPKL